MIPNFPLAPEAAREPCTDELAPNALEGFVVGVTFLHVEDPLKGDKESGDVNCSPQPVCPQGHTPPPLLSQASLCSACLSAPRGRSALRLGQ